jgi:hypothetical protein
MKKFYVGWLEEFGVNVEAETEDEAIAKARHLPSEPKKANRYGYEAFEWSPKGTIDKENKVG